MNPKVTISILAYDGLEHTVACLESVARNSHGHDYELILTDNGSTDGTAEFFAQLQRENPDRVIVVSNEKNMGFIAPNRHALSIARGSYFVTLNNDVKVPPHWLTWLLDPLEQFPKAALTGPSGSCSELTTDFSGIPSRKLDYLEGSCLCGKTEILKRHGLFSDYLEFAYHEDSDLSLRMQELGYTIHRVPFRIQHVREVTSKRVSKVKEYAEKNRSAMLKRWSAWRRGRKFNYPVIIRRKASSGDVLLASAVVKAISERCPRSLILVETDCIGVMAGNPRVMRVTNRLPSMSNARLIDLDMAYENRPGMHIISAYAKEAMVGPIELITEFNVSKLVYDRAAKQIGMGTWIAIHAGPTTWDGKNWPEERWQMVIDHLIEVGWKVLLVGNPGYDLRNHMDMRGKTKINELAALLKCCQLFCGVDSFLMHMAQAVGTPIVPLFGVTDPKYILTFGSKAYPVCSDPDNEFTGMRHRISGATHVNVDPGANPMRTIEVEQVIEKISIAMNRPQEAMV